MNKHRSFPRRPSALETAMSASLCAVLLAGCGGSGGDNRPAAEQGSAPADFLGVGTASSDRSAGHDLLVIDRENPGSPARLSVRQRAEENFVLSKEARRVSAAAQGVQWGTPSMAYFVQDRKVFQVSLRKTDGTVPRQISSLETACSAVDASRRAAEAGSTWVEIEEAGPDGDCAARGDNRSAFVRTGTPSNIAATFLPAAVKLGPALAMDAASLPLFFLATDSRGSGSKLVLYSPGLVPAGDVSGGAVTGEFKLLTDPEANGAGFQVTGLDDTGPRRLNWSASGAALSHVFYNFQQPIVQASSQLFADADFLYVSDGLQVLRRARGSNGAFELVGTLDAALGDRSMIRGITPTRIIVAQATAGGTGGHLVSVPKQGGAIRTLATSAAQAPLPEIVSGEHILYFTQDNGSPPRLDMHRVQSDGTGQTLVASNVTLLPQAVYSRDATLAGSAPTGLLWCENAPGEADCTHGNLHSIEVASGAVSPLGALSLPPSASFQSLFDPDTSTQLFPDSPMVISVDSQVSNGGSTTSATDSYVFRVGVAGALLKLPSTR